MKDKKIELLAPAGDLEKLKWAVLYGADAVYLGGVNYSLRANAKNFTLKEIKEGVKFAHEHGVKVYVTVNIVFHNNDVNGFEDYLKELDKIGVDAVIFSDPLVIDIAHKNNLKLELHLSTQASILNKDAAKYFNVDFLRYFVLSKSSDRDFLNKLTSFYRNSYCNNENICRIRYILETKNEHEFTMQETLTSFVFNEVYATDYKTGNCSLKYKSLHDLAMFCFTYEINSIRKEINISSKEKEENRIKMLNSLKTPKPKIRTLKKKNYELEGQMSFDDLEY